MMSQPKPTSTQEEVYEWIEEDGVLIKITSKNSNGRKCGHCGCNCPCRCKCCQLRCCKSRL